MSNEAGTLFIIVLFLTATSKEGILSPFYLISFLNF